MDIKKEMEQYEAVLKEAGYGHRSLSKSSLGYLNPITQFGFEVWFNAQKQTVPEGFVLIEKTKLMQIVGSAAIIEPITRGNPLMSKYKTELDFILSTVRAVIEAQGQKVTEMKINWGMGCPRCNHNEAIIHSTAEKDSGYEFMNGDAVNCLKCGNIGEMDANGEDSDIVWNEDEAQKQNHD